MGKPKIKFSYVDTKGTIRNITTSSFPKNYKYLVDNFSIYTEEYRKNLEALKRGDIVVHALKPVIPCPVEEFLILRDELKLRGRTIDYRVNGHKIFTIKQEGKSLEDSMKRLKKAEKDVEKAVRDIPIPIKGENVESRIYEYLISNHKDLFDEVVKSEREVRLKTEISLGEVRENYDLIPIEEFLDKNKDIEGIERYEIAGYYSTSDSMSNIPIYPSDCDEELRKDFTHVAIFK